MASVVVDQVVRLLHEESGQDLVEYAILTAIVTVGGLLLFSAIRLKMVAAYSGYGTAIQVNWSPNDPIPRTP